MADKDKMKRLWRGLLERCYQPSCRGYHKYGARGIRVCERWHDYSNFLADMGQRPDGHSLERVDNNGPYSPENCIWADHKTQNRNRRNNRLITYRGETMCIEDWAEKSGIGRTTLRSRLDAGWGVHRALTVPLRKDKRREEKCA